MRPIPKKLLIHTVTTGKSITEDRWGDKQESSEAVLQYVRMEPTIKVVRDRDNAEIQLVAILFYDCRNSSPGRFEFAVDDTVTFGDQKYKVQTIESLYDNDKLHHCELGLIKGV